MGFVIQIAWNTDTLVKIWNTDTLVKVWNTDILVKKGSEHGLWFWAMWNIFSAFFYYESRIWWGFLSLKFLENLATMRTRISVSISFEISRQKYLYEQSQCDPKQFERFFNFYYPRDHQEEMFALMIRHDQNFRSLAFLRRPKIQSCMKMRTMPCSRWKAHESFRF